MVLGVAALGLHQAGGVASRDVAADKPTIISLEVL
jgi:hypothetical protein